jgi:hypothetical protein
MLLGHRIAEHGSFVPSEDGKTMKQKQRKRAKAWAKDRVRLDSTGCLVILSQGFNMNRIDRGIMFNQRDVDLIRELLVLTWKEARR